jgi:hypothetical protein
VLNRLSKTSQLDCVHIHGPFLSVLVDFALLPFLALAVGGPLSEDGTGTLARNKLRQDLPRKNMSQYWSGCVEMDY